MIHVRRDNVIFVFTVAFLIIFTSLVLKVLQNVEFTPTYIKERSVEGENPELKPDNNNGPHAGKCGLAASCPRNGFAFKIASGATNAVGPQICFDGKIIFEKTIGTGRPGITIAVVKETTGELITTATYNMWNGDVRELIKFLNSIEDGSFVFMATFDDPATKLNEEARNIIAELGSAYVSKLQFRDNWVFVGGRKTMTQVSFEQHRKNDKSTNKYGYWPEMIEIEGCIPRLD